MENKDSRYCPICRKCIKLNAIDKHLSDCAKLSLNTLSESTIVSVPQSPDELLDKDDTHYELARDALKLVMEFKNYKNMLIRPCIAHADTECTLTPTSDPNKVSIHTPNSACFYFV